MTEDKIKTLQADQLRKRLEEIRKSRNFARKEWARKAGLADRTLGVFLSGKSQTMTAATLEKLARAASVSLDVVLGLEPDPFSTLEADFKRSGRSPRSQDETGVALADLTSLVSALRKEVADLAKAVHEIKGGGSDKRPTIIRGRR